MHGTAIQLTMGKKKVDTPGESAKDSILVGDAGSELVPSKRKKSKFKVATEARRRARLGIGLPPPERTITEKRLKKPKHKKKLEDLVVED
jgi:hypothetical protein